tara:strand:+ start:682 stop:807 length:126 start_codon:yes stop_codon:yes gene_type:complete
LTQSIVAVVVIVAPAKQVAAKEKKDETYNEKLEKAFERSSR